MKLATKRLERLEARASKSKGPAWLGNPKFIMGVWHMLLRAADWHMYMTDPEWNGPGNEAGDYGTLLARYPSSGIDFAVRLAHEMVEAPGYTEACRIWAKAVNNLERPPRTQLDVANNEIA